MILHSRCKEILPYRQNQASLLNLLFFPRFFLLLANMYFIWYDFYVKHIIDLLSMFICFVLEIMLFEKNFFFH